MTLEKGLKWRFSCKEKVWAWGWRREKKGRGKSVGEDWARMGSVRRRV
jgi:hypothetical protein